MTAEYLGSTYADLDFHLGGAKARRSDRRRWRRASACRCRDEVVLRHRPPHFPHIFSGDSYAAAYYSYMWAEVLDADAFNAFEETGDVFDPAVRQEACTTTSTRRAARKIRRRPIRRSAARCRRSIRY